MAKQINALTSTRGFAAIAVVIFHFGQEIFPFNRVSVFNYGNLAVSYFFVLSGFVMLYTYQDKYVSYREFIIKRIARIAPLYLLAIFISIAPTIVLAALGKQNPPPHFVTSLLLNIGFLQAHIPGYVYGINTPGWSLSVEMMFYALFPLFLVLYRNNWRRFAVATVLFFILSQAAHLMLLKHPAAETDIMHQFIYYHPLLHMNEFLIGMLGARLLKKNGDTFAKIPSILILLAAIFTIETFGGKWSMHNGLIGPLFLAFIVAVSAREPRFLQIKALVYFGDISYGIYILQKPLTYYVYSILNPKILHLDAANIFYVYLAILIGVSALSYEMVEKPLRNRINKLAKGKQPAVQPAKS